MGKHRGLVQEQVLHDQAFEGAQRGLDVLGIRIRLRDILALAIQSLEMTIERGIQHVRNTQTGLAIEFDIPLGLETSAHRGVRHMPVAGKFVRERTHVAGTLHCSDPATG